MAYHNILSKLDRALVAYVISAGAGTAADTFPAKRSLQRSAPCTVCWSEKAEEISLYSQCFQVEVSILVKTLAPVDTDDEDDDPAIASDARVAAVFDAFFTDLDSAGDKLADLVTAAARALAIAEPDRHSDLADFTCLNVEIGGPEAGFEEDTDNWVDTLNLKVNCAPANVS